MFSCIDASGSANSGDTAARPSASANLATLSLTALRLLTLIDDQRVGRHLLQHLRRTAHRRPEGQRRGDEHGAEGRDTGTTNLTANDDVHCLLLQAALIGRRGRPPARSAHTSHGDEDRNPPQPPVKRYKTAR